ncbi:putative nuclear pore complex protein Nup98-Nup96 isoform X2 [Penaeus vannamei]|uniref:Nuclear pore complex protein Nup98-Nup96 n=1 Tax=Penaeus vannamei TaxID=6689 RepID=A0A3R7N1W3_PENVA|nr:putative nuclear pore complex protein Nup98-Nup96 isoform X2 [Penaeus vannamei]
MFGQPRAPFGGTTSSFGASFGTPSTTTTGFGNTSFGRTTFGNPQQTTSFGTTTTPFGGATSSGTSLFGTQQQPATGGLFGQQQTQQPSTGFSHPSSGFGSTSGGGLFGQTQQPTSTGLFGSTGTSGFGAQQSTQSRPFGFGQTTTSTTAGAGGLFGTTQPTTGGGLFSGTTGFGATGGAVTGTTVKYEPVTGTDTMTRNGVSTNIRTRIEVISTMKEYENKSLEELRVEDYLANRKGPGQGTTLPGFGQTPQATSTQPQMQGTGLFGTSTGTSLFGTAKPPENKSLFGTGTTSGGGLFGSGTSTAAFGQTSTAPATSFSFNQTTQQQQKTGAFSFGTTPTSTPSLFGSTPQQQQQPSFGFSGGFQLGQNTQQQNTGGGLFGNQKPGFFSNQNTGTGLFGSKPAGTTQPLTTGFGTTNPVPPFGSTPNTSAGGGLFGAQNTQNKTGMFSGFGFALPQQTAVGGAAGGSAYPDLGKLVKALTEKPFLNITNNEKSSSDKSSSPSDQGGSKLTSSNLKPTYVLSPSLVANNKLKPKPIAKNNNQGNDRHWLFKGLDDPNEESSEDFLKPKKYPSVRKLNLKVFKAAKADSSLSSPTVSTTADKPGAGDAPSPLTTPVSPIGDSTPIRTSLPPSHDSSPTPDIIKGREKIKSLNLRSKPQMNDTLADLNVVQLAGAEAVEGNLEGAENDEKDSSAEADKENISIFDVSAAEDIPAMVNKSSDKPHPAGIKLTRSGYFTLPPLDVLAEMLDSDGQCLVENFTVGRYGYGNVCFLGVTDVAGIDLDSVVFILRKQIEVYPEGTQKPPQGQELNKPAIITLDCVWPVDKTTREVIKSSERLQAMGWADYLERQCVKMESTFVEYRPETGSWVFKVPRF